MQRWVVVLLPVGTANPYYSITIQLLRCGHNCTTALRTAINKHCLISAFPHNDHGTSATSTPLEEKQHAKLFGCVVWGWLLAIVWGSVTSMVRPLQQPDKSSRFSLWGGGRAGHKKSEHRTQYKDTSKKKGLLSCLLAEQ